MARGFLAGFPMIDVKVRVYDGKYHDVDSSDAAFQLAGARVGCARRAARAARPARADRALQVTVPGDYMGDVIGDINRGRGRVTGTDSSGSESVVQALLPLASTSDYEPKLTSITSGRGSFTLGFDHYDFSTPHTTDKVVKESGFKHVEDED